MEKNYFKDRCIEATIRNKLYIGNDAYICLKVMQKYAKEINDLTRVTITRHLTSQPEHPRGCKVQGDHYKTNNLGHILSENNCPIIESCVGRCTYLVNEDDTILTSEGNKLIVRENNSFRLEKIEILESFYQLKAVFQIENTNLYLEFPVDLYAFFHSQQEAIDAIQNYQLNNFFFNGTYIFGNINGDNIFVKKYKIVYNNKYLNISNTQLLEYLNSIKKTYSYKLFLREFFL